MNILVFLLGLSAALLGGLWLLQGLGIVRIQPIFCLADCATIESASITWAAIGAAVLAAGGAGMFFSLTKRPR